MARQTDLLAIGDIVTDAFIKLIDNQAYVTENDQGKWLTMQFGTKLPFDHAEVLEGVGNASNAAVSASRLGLKTSFVTNVGDDKEGLSMIRALQKEKIKK